MNNIELNKLLNFKNKNRQFDCSPKANVSRTGFLQIIIFEKLRLCTLYFLLCTLGVAAQVTTKIDTTRIRIGEQISYKIKVESSKTAHNSPPKCK